MIFIWNCKDAQQRADEKAQQEHDARLAKRTGREKATDLATLAAILGIAVSHSR